MKHPKTVSEQYEDWKQQFISPEMDESREMFYRFAFYSGVFFFNALMVANSDKPQRERNSLYQQWREEVENEIERLLNIARQDQPFRDN